MPITYQWRCAAHMDRPASSGRRSCLPALTSARLGGASFPSRGPRPTHGSLSHLQLLVTPWTVALQAPLSMGFSRQNTGVGCHSLFQGIFLSQGLNPGLQSGACGIVVSQSVTEPESLALTAQSSNHWTSGDPLEDGFLATGPLGKSLKAFYKQTEK